jgi:L-asparaginase
VARLTDPARRIACFTTGGTIASSYVESAGGPLPTVPGPDLVHAVPGLADLADVDVVELANSSSHAIRPEEVFEWAKRVQHTLRDPAIVGAVVTHGTATLEESAYLFDLLLAEDKPIVFTGAMRSHDEVGSDGPRNLLQAAQVALAPTARGLGVLVVLNGDIHAARDVSKSDSDRVDTFVSRYGSLGRIFAGRGDEVVIHRLDPVREHIPADSIESRVAYVKTLMGSDSSVIDAAVESGARGIVIEGFAGGEITPYMADGVERALAAGLTLVVASRAASGRPNDAWPERGAGGWLRDRGVLSAGELTGPKARLKLMLALGTGDEKLLRRLFRQT